MKRNVLHEIMSLAWQFVKRNGFTMSEALKIAWANMKLKAAMKQRIVKFYFKKVDGSVREAYGTLKENLIPATLTIMINEEVLKIVMNNKTFGRNEAADIVGGLSRLMRLVGQGKIRAEKRTNKQNGKWFCNAYDVLKHATLK